MNKLKIRSAESARLSEPQTLKGLKKMAKKQKISNEIAADLFRARKTVRAAAIDLANAKEAHKEAREHLEKVQDHLNGLIDDAEKGPGPIFKAAVEAAQEVAPPAGAEVVQ